MTTHYILYDRWKLFVRKLWACRKKCSFLFRHKKNCNKKHIYLYINIATRKIQRVEQANSDHCGDLHNSPTPINRRSSSIAFFPLHWQQEDVILLQQQQQKMVKEKGKMRSADRVVIASSTSTIASWLWLLLQRRISSPDAAVCEAANWPTKSDRLINALGNITTNLCVFELCCWCCCRCRCLGCGGGGHYCVVSASLIILITWTWVSLQASAATTLAELKKDKGIEEILKVSFFFHIQICEGSSFF